MSATEREEHRVRLLLIEDDAEAAAIVSEGLTSEGHDVHLEATGRKGLARLRTEPFDLLVVDRMLPDMEGVEVVEAARLEGSTVPVLMLTALGSIEDRVGGLRGGADDYLVKPFAMAELLARIDALARRAGTAERSACGPIRIDRLRREAWRDGQRIVLHPREFELLEQLVGHGGPVVCRTMLLERVWHFHFHPETHIGHTHNSPLRQKINAGFQNAAIQTIPGGGYFLRHV